MLIDSHCHIPLISDNKSDQALIIKNAVEVGVTHMLCISVDLETVEDVLYWSRNHKQVSASVGVHPTYVEGKLASAEEIATLAEDPTVIAVGETGLDFYQPNYDSARQEEQFRNHIRCAKNINKPLIVHCRNAASSLLKILKEEDAKKIGGIMHCFVEDWETAKAAMDLGFYISFSGILTFKNAKDLQDVSKKIPLDRILIETDSPWLSPAPLRGKTNQPAHLIHTLRFLAHLREEEEGFMSEQTTKNFNRLFRL